jgi:hypothetical protein
MTRIFFLSWAISVLFVVVGAITGWPFFFQVGCGWFVGLPVLFYFLYKECK